MVVRWTDPAKAELSKIFKYIAEDSLQNTEKVTEALLGATYELLNNSTKYPLDKFKLDNEGAWRAFELYNYRVSYHIENDIILIVRIRHTKRSPLRY